MYFTFQWFLGLHFDLVGNCLCAGDHADKSAMQRYSPPEVWAKHGERHESKILVEPSVDIWAIGVIIYEILTGRDAFPRPTHASSPLRHSDCAFGSHVAALPPHFSEIRSDDLYKHGSRISAESLLAMGSDHGSTPMHSRPSSLSQVPDVHTAGDATPVRMGSQNYQEALQEAMWRGHLSPALKRVVMECLAEVPTQRPLAAQLLLMWKDVEKDETGIECAEKRLLSLARHLIDAEHRVAAQTAIQSDIKPDSPGSVVSQPDDLSRGLPDSAV